MSIRFASFGVVIAIALIAGCSAEATGSEEASTTSDIVANVLADTAKVEKDRLIFPTSSIDQSLRDRINNKERVIMVSDRQRDAADTSGMIRNDVGNPFGYLRRAISVRDEGGKTIIMTEDATLDEALQELEASETITVGSATKNAGGVSPLANHTFTKTIPVLDIKDKELFRSGGAFIKIKTARVSVDTKLDLGVSIGFPGRLNHAHAAIDADVDSDLILEAGGTIAFDANPETSVLTGSWPVGSIGPIPVTLNLDTKVGCNLGADGQLNATAGVHADFFTGAGLTYERGKGMDASTKPSTFTPTLIAPAVTANASAFAECYIKPELSLLLAGMVGPTITPKAFARIDANSPLPIKATLKGGVAVSVGGKLAMFGKDLGPRIDREVFRFDKELWHN